MSCQPPGSPCPTLHFDPDLPCPLQHASADVEKMILGNKCDVNDKRQVSKERGEKVGAAPGGPHDPLQLGAFLPSLFKTDSPEMERPL